VQFAESPNASRTYASVDVRRELHARIMDDR